MSKRKADGGSFKAPQGDVSSAKKAKSDTDRKKAATLKRAKWTGVEMQAGEDKTTEWNDEHEETEHSKYALSSDEEDDVTKLDPLNVKKSQKELLKKQAEKKRVAFDATADKQKKKGEEDQLYDPDNTLEKDHRFIDNQEFTAFNLEEEREDGKFTEDGRYEWNLDEDEKKGADEWLSSTDWKKIDRMGAAKRAEFRAKFDADQEILNNDGAITYTKRDVIECVNEVIGLLLPHENVAKALKRLRPKKKLNAQRQKQQARMKQNKYGFDDVKPAETEENIEENPEIAADAKLLKQISDLANKIAGSGYYEVYSDSISQLQTYIDKLKEEIGDNKQAAKDDDMDDMFADIDESENKPKSADEEPKTEWEYRWGEDGELFGPFSTQDMIDWKEAGFFTDTPQPAMCRRVNTTSFYDAKRCDFDLYN